MQQYPDWLKVKKCKKIDTYDLTDRYNGYLIDILNRNDQIMKDRQQEQFQQVYMSTILKNKFKGFHVHPIKTDTLHCVYGNFCLVLCPEIIEKDKADSISLDSDKLLFLELGTNNPITVTFPSKYPHGFFGIDEFSIIINYRNPAWTPSDTYQYDIKSEETVKTLLTKYNKQGSYQNA